MRRFFALHTPWGQTHFTLGDIEDFCRDARARGFRSGSEVRAEYDANEMRDRLVVSEDER